LSTVPHVEPVDQTELEQLYESKVISRDGERVGTVIDLVRRGGNVTAFEVSGGGMFGTGAGHYRLPVDSIVRIDGLNLYVDRHSRELI
jgi:sporulation protein YlmC with PRC-barrel domain